MNRRLYRLLGNLQSMLGLALIIYVFMIAIAAPYISPPDDPQNPTPFRIVEGFLDPTPVSPNEDLPLGTVAYYSNADSFELP